jgi:uncharacterized membrane protein
MHWLLAILGAIFGAAFGEADAAVLGLFFGALLGWQGGRIVELRQRLAALEKAGTSPAPAAAALRAAAPPVISISAPPEPRDDAQASPGEGMRSAVSEAPSAPAAAAAAATVAPAARAPAAAEPPRMPPPLPRATAPAAAAGPDLFERIGATLKRWLFEGNVPVKAGVLVLFIGVAAALRYAVEQGMLSFPIELRLAGIAAAGLAALVWGWRNRVERPAFGLALQGGAIGVLLLTVFAAFRLYQLLPAGAAFAMVLLLVAGAALLALLQNAMALAVLGFVGGYLGPVLISTGSGNHVALFSYYAVLNAAVFAIAWMKPWRVLNLVGFAFTFGIGTLWGARYYRPELFASVEPFLVLFFLFYALIPVLYALRADAKRQALVDGTLVFGTPLLAFPLQVALLGDDRAGLAWSALAVAAVYVALAAWVRRRGAVPLLGQSFAALALGFATLAVPLALSARWTSAAWAVEGAALVWLGLRQQRMLPQLAGWLLQALAVSAYFGALAVGGWDAGEGEWVVLNGHALSVLLMALAAFAISWLYDRAGGHRAAVWAAFLLGLAWWCTGGLREIVEHFGDGDWSLLFTAFAAITAGVAATLRGVVPWPRLGWIVVGVALVGPMLALGTWIDRDGLPGLRENVYWLAWFGVMLVGLLRLREPEQRAISLAHVGVLATAAFLYGLALNEEAARGGLDDAWRYAATWSPLALLLLATWRLPGIACWPLADRFARYAPRWFIPALAALVLGWSLGLVERGGSAPLPHLPLLNPLELFQLGTLLVLVAVARRRGERDLLALLAGAGLVFATFAGLRAVHHYGDAPWSPAILSDHAAQATLTVIWSLAGVLAWVIGSRRRHFGVWLAGAILMGVVLLKLLLVDRRFFGDLTGIVSFLAVGGLLVLVGRIAPTPPRSASVRSDPQES